MGRLYAHRNVGPLGEVMIETEMKSFFLQGNEKLVWVMRVVVACRHFAGDKFCVAHSMGDRGLFLLIFKLDIYFC